MGKRCGISFHPKSTSMSLVKTTAMIAPHTRENVPVISMKPLSTSASPNDTTQHSRLIFGSVPKARSLTITSLRTDGYWSATPATRSWL